MKTINLIRKSLLLGFILIMSSSLYAQDPVKVASNVYKKVVLNNEKVRVIEIEFAPGEVAPWHHHPAHVAYVLTGGDLEITDKGKTAQVVTLKEGEAMYLPAVTHMAKNVGTTTIKLVVTEIKPGHQMTGSATMKKEPVKMENKTMK
ncbi:MAG TPA: cupin domain-containing protein [Paludibacter sp.]